AAVATAAVLSVVEPYSAGMGGGGFWLLHDARNQRWTVVDAREVAPLAASHDMYLGADGNPRAGRPSVDGPLAAAIPGQPAAFAHIVERYGKLSLSAVLRDAVRLAREGFRIGPTYERLARQRQDSLLRYPASRSLFLDQGQAPRSGSMLEQPQLARTLHLLGLRGHQGFYGGEIAEELVQDVRDAGGIWSLEDLAQCRVIEREPLEARLPGDVRVLTVPPPSSGGVALLQMLGMLHEFDWRQLDPVTRKHLIVEVMKLAYRDRATHLGDPDFVEVPLKRLLAPEYIAELAGQISLDRALPVPVANEPAPASFHTTHLSVVDRDGNMVSATLSINLAFGSAFTSGQ